MAAPMPLHENRPSSGETEYDPVIHGWLDERDEPVRLTREGTILAGLGGLVALAAVFAAFRGQTRAG